MTADAVSLASRRYFTLLLTAAAAFSGAAVCGWFLHIRVLVQIVGGQWAMVLSTAAGCLILSTSLLAIDFAAPDRGRLIALVSGALLVALGITATCENIWHINLGLDLPALHAALVPEYRPPGRMGMNTAIVLTLFGLNLVGYAYRLRAVVASVARYLLVPIFVTALVGIMTRWLDLNDLFSWLDISGFVRMSPLTSVVFLLIALGAWQLWDEALKSAWSDEKIEALRILHTAAFILTLTAVATGIAGITLLQSRLMNAMQQSLERTGMDDANSIDLQLTQRADRAAILSNQGMVMDALTRFSRKPADTAAVQALHGAAEALLKHGFSAVAFHGAHAGVVEAGSMIQDPAVAVPLNTIFPARLLWKDGYFLESSVPMQTGSGLAGFLVSQQPLNGLTRLSDRANHAGRTGELSLCSEEAGGLVCFPDRSNPAPFRIPRSALQDRVPLRKALRGESGSMVAEIQGHRVLAAYGPIGTTHLGLDLKMDTVEILGPVRRGLEVAAPLIVLLIVAGFWAMNRRIRPLVQKLISSREYIRHLAMHDALTHLPNRILLEDRIAVALRDAVRQGGHAGVLMVDLDRFKEINDRLGHAAGDKVLVQVAERLKHCIRDSDTAARFGGDEFVVLLPHLNHPADTAVVAQKILDNLKKPVLVDGAPLTVTPSIGAAAFPSDGTDMRTLLQHADLAMYHAKSAGRNRFSAYTAEMRPSSAMEMHTAEIHS